DANDRAYARRADEDDVVLVDTKALRDLGTQPSALRSQKVADIDPKKVGFVEVQAEGLDHLLARRDGSWSVLEPASGPADEQAVQALLTQLAQVQTSEFLNPKEARDPGLESPSVVIRVWEGAAASASEAQGKDRPSKPKGEPALNLQLGRHEPVAKVI